MVLVDYELRLIFFSINLRPYQLSNARIYQGRIENHLPPPKREGIIANLQGLS